MGCGQGFERDLLIINLTLMASGGKRCVFLMCSEACPDENRGGSIIGPIYEQ